MIALDVGTRTLAAAEVVGGVIRRLVVHEHAGTPMRGGQVQDLTAVARGVRALREELELPEGTPASMAIAGGLLRTEAVSVSVLGPGPWTEADLHAAEIDAITRTRDARKKHWEAVDGSASHAHGELLMDLARGHVTRDGESVGSLVGMAGTTGSWTVLSSWLPLEQVRLKMEAVTAGGFSPRTITVEPLAVSAALFGTTPPPATYAVIDIGAGTSDIAVFAPAGLVEAASVPLAGDTITAAIATALSLDHLAADRLKRDPGASIRDLWGDEKRYKAATLMEAAETGVAALVSAVADRLRSLSPVLPAGIILVGGGSLWADLPERLAAALDLPADRVRRRGAETVAGIKDETGKVRGPAFLTLLGIIRTEHSSFSRRRFRRDGVSHWTLARMREAGSPEDGSHSATSGRAWFTVADALAALGEDPSCWFGAPGPSIVDGVNVLGGAVGEPPVVTVNGRPATLDTPLQDDDDFSIARGSSGASAVSAQDHQAPPAPQSVPESTATAILPASSLAPVAAQPSSAGAVPATGITVTLDGKPIHLDSPAETYDDAQLLTAVKAAAESKGFVTLDGNRVYVGERRQILRIEAGVYASREIDPPTIASVAQLPVHRALELVVNGSPVSIHDATRTALVNGQRRSAAHRAPWDAVISTERGPWRLYEVLTAHSGPAGSPHLNGQSAPWTAEVRAGDRVEFR